MKVGKKPITVHPLRQNFTPAWAAERLVEEFFPNLSARDIVLEPTCGDGRFLCVIPSHIDVFGVEIDPVVAEAARRNSGRTVITGDIRMVKLPRDPTAIIGNIPFQVGLLNALLDRASEWLPEGGQMGLLMSSQMLQNAATVLRWREKRWGVKPHQVPKSLFGHLPNTLVWTMFEKGGRKLWGFALYEELHTVQGLRGEHRDILTTSGKTWRQVLEQVLQQLGGEADLADIYQAIEPVRPTENKWWQAKVRQTAAQNFHRVREGRYALKAAA